QYGIPISREQAIEFIGPPLTDSFRSVAETAEQSTEMVNIYREHNMHNHDAYVTTFPYVTETLERLHQQGLKLGIVTSKASQTVDKGMVLTAIKPFFDTVITLDDVSQANPHPEPVLKIGRASGRERAE